MEGEARFFSIRFLPLVLAYFVGSSLIAQESPPTPHYKHDVAVFAEAWGEGIFNSINIEKTLETTSLVSYHLRMGIGYWSPDDGTIVTLPVNASLSYGNQFKVELTVGATPFWLSTKEARTSNALAPTLGLHLRFMDAAGGPFIRLGALIAPMTKLNEIPGNKDKWKNGSWGWNPGIALGYLF